MIGRFQRSTEPVFSRDFPILKIIELSADPRRIKSTALNLAGIANIGAKFQAVTSPLRPLPLTLAYIPLRR